MFQVFAQPLNGFFLGLRKISSHEKRVSGLMQHTVRDIHNSTMANPPPDFLPELG